MNGKGDRNRPVNISREEWDRKYQEIFGKDNKKNPKRKDKSKDGK